MTWGTGSDRVPYPCILSTAGMTCVSWFLVTLDESGRGTLFEDRRQLLAAALFRNGMQGSQGGQKLWDWIGLEYRWNYVVERRLCRRRGWNDPSYECYRDHSGYTCLVLVNGREYQTDLAYQSDSLAQENAAMRAFMVCRNFSVNGGMLARNGIVQGLPATEPARRSKKSRHTSSSHSSRDSHRRSGHHSSSSSTASFD
ncbi:hypothetical protein CSAL01_09528 [Colletotrichum salicis]|uniref:DRBM domain-containing protein n=1 Tax=Colletotrichum salicis TaxID=1209931 RepID=A0A135VAJ7_9PEZI|nr:hypothetical protein CSAL01_09528 [Colletotrichum salicis]